MYTNNEIVQEFIFSSRKNDSCKMYLEDYDTAEEMSVFLVSATQCGTRVVCFLFGPHSTFDKTELASSRSFSETLHPALQIAAVIPRH